MINDKEVILVASENGALAGAKIGGVADVVRDLPSALVAEGWTTLVVIPSYGILHTRPGAKKLNTIAVEFAGETTYAVLWEVPGQLPAVRNLVIDHERFSRDGVGVIYFSDQSDAPFAADASKFAFFCACVGSWLLQREKAPAVIHLHDWHSAFYCILREFDPRYSRLKLIRTVFTVHNLAYQGTRPIDGHASSLQSWFPAIQHDDRVLDPNYRDCVNPMASAIRLADAISTVSPKYAREICEASNPAVGFIGGEGLESDLQDAASAGRLAGILNGCFYDRATPDIDWPTFQTMAIEQVALWSAANPDNPAHALAAKRLTQFEKRPSVLLTSIGRLVAQKATLLVAATDGFSSALAGIAADLGKDGLVIVLGSGEPKLESAILQIAKASDNVIFLQGYSDSIADPLYGLGDLFLMPSSFEPCGISQMLAMRAGQPCVVHGVGGLRDTVEHEVTGFVFDGDSITSQANAFLVTVKQATNCLRSRDDLYSAIRKNALACRFEWRTAAQRTIKQLYERRDAE